LVTTATLWDIQTLRKQSSEHVLSDIQTVRYLARMADDSKIQPTSDFTRRFSAALREVMSHRGVSGNAVAREIGRNQGFVSERTSGKRPCDTDIIAGVAAVAGVDPRTIVRETLAAMGVARATGITLPRQSRAARTRNLQDPQG
jgi:hypothetical protein